MLLVPSNEDIGISTAVGTNEITHSLLTQSSDKEVSTLRYLKHISHVIIVNNYNNCFLQRHTNATKTLFLGV